MKKIIAILILIIAYTNLFAQSTPDSARFIWYRYQYGVRQPRLQIDSLQDIPKDTAYSKWGIARKGHDFFIGNGVYWHQVGDTTAIYTAINNIMIYLGDTSFTNQFMPFGILTDTSYYLPNSADSIRRTEYTDGTIVDDTLTTSIVSSIVNNITTIINAIDSIRTDTTFALDRLRFYHDPNSRNDSLKLLTFTTDTIGGVPPPLSVTGKFLRDDGTWQTAGGGGSQTLQQVFDQETGEALLNKSDTINTASHSFFIKDNSTGTGSLNYRFDSVGATGKSTGYTQNGKEILMSAQNNLSGTVIPSLTLSANTNTASIQTQAGATLTNLTTYKDSLVIKNNTKTFLKFNEFDEGLMTLPQYGDGNFVSTPDYLLGVLNGGGTVVAVDPGDFGSSDWKLTGNSGTNPTTNFLGTIDSTDLQIRTKNINAVNVSAIGDVCVGCTVTGGYKFKTLGSAGVTGQLTAENNIVSLGHIWQFGQFVTASSLHMGYNPYTHFKIGSGFLDIKSSTKGILIPRIADTALIDKVVTSITITSGGSGYTTPPTVTVGSDLLELPVAVLTGDAVTSITWTSSEAATVAPSISLSGGGGTGAAATANLGWQTGLTFFNTTAKKWYFYNGTNWAEMGGGGAGNPNSNIGSGYRLAVPNTNNIKTLFAGTNISMDSTTNANGITISAGAPSYTSQALTDGATITWNYASGSIATVTLGGNRTLAITNPVNNSYGQITITQDGTGSRTITLPASSKVVNGGGGAITLTTTAAAKDVLSFFYDGSFFYWNYGKNYN